MVQYLLLRTPPFYAVMSVYYILRFSVTFYSTLTSRTKNNLYCSQKLVKRFRNSELGYIKETPRIIGLWIKSHQKFDLKQKSLTQQVTSVQFSVRLKYSKSFCSELLEHNKLNTKFKNAVKLIKFNSKELEGFCKQFDQNKDWVSSLPSYSSSIIQYQHAFKSLMNTCLSIDNNLDHKLEQGYAFKSVCDFISDFIDQTHLQLEGLTDAGIGSYQLTCLASNVSTGMDFIEELLRSPLVQDIHLHWICVGHINILIDRCFTLGERINGKK